MSLYTTEVRFICESLAGYQESVGLSKVPDVLEKSWSKVFDFDFPMFDEQYRSVLCQKILLHYYTREISAETVGLWKLWLRRRMNEIMPYYNKLYESEKFKFDPMTDVDLTTTHKGSGSNAGTVDNTGNDVREGSGNSTNKGTVGDSGKTTRSGSGSGTGGNNATSTKAFSDTPMGQLQQVKDMKYLSSAQVDTDSNSQTSSYKDSEESTNANTQTRDLADTFTNSETIARTNTETRDLTSTDEYVQTVKGKTSGASYMKLVAEFRKNLLNIDNMIIEELSDLFFHLW